MTTTVPKIFSFEEFAGVADAVANQIVHAQDAALAEAEIQANNNNTNNVTLQGNNKSPSVQIAKAPYTNSSNSSSHATINTNKSASNLKLSKTQKKLERRFKIAISGGSLIKILSNGLLKRDDIRWDKWDIFFADERLVPFDSPDSNYGSAKREIFDKLEENGISPPNVYHIDESLINDAQDCADEYEKTLIKSFASKDSVRLPLFDLFLLGCAPDGHIASIFPHDHQVLREKLAWCVPVENAPSGPSRRITLTIPVICHSHRVCFVVEGAVKASIVKVILERPEKGLPASVVNELAAGRVSWFVDKAALTETYL